MGDAHRVGEIVQRYLARDLELALFTGADQRLALVSSEIGAEGPAAVRGLATEFPDRGDLSFVADGLCSASVTHRQDASVFVQPPLYVAACSDHAVAIAGQYSPSKNIVWPSPRPASSLWRVSYCRVRLFARGPFFD